MMAQVSCITPTLSTTSSSFTIGEVSGMEEHKIIQSGGSREREDESQGYESMWQQTGLQAKSLHISRVGGVGGFDSSTEVCA